MRSDDAIACCSRPYFSARSSIGEKNWSTSCQKASSVPIVSVPASTQAPPAMKSAAVVTARVIVMSGEKVELMRIESRLAWR